MKNIKKIGTNVVLILAWLWILLLSYGAMTIIDDKELCNPTAQFDWKYPIIGIILFSCVVLAITATMKKGKYLLLLPLVFLLPYLPHLLYYSKVPVSRYDKLGSTQIQQRFPFCLYIEKN
jgi:hypothetical protein